MKTRWWQRVAAWLTTWRRPPNIPTPLWHAVVEQHPVLARRSPSEQKHLQHLASAFLAQKEFAGGQGLVVTDAMAVGIAAQACLPLLYWGPDALDWYADFVGVVVHPDEVVAQRTVVDDSGVVHQYRETLAGEAMQGGPVMLAWSHVLGGHTGPAVGHNLVIHEFAHKLDMRHKGAYHPPDGCPALPPGFMGLTSTVAAHRFWRDTLYQAWEDHQQRTEMAQRFGGPAPWLDPYGATSPVEFFAVACEAYFADPEGFAQACPTVWPLLLAFFQPGPLPALSAGSAPQQSL
ncbi:MAG: hypothetical protein RJA09_2110 [Pseudomonadota bacterium]